MKQIKNSAMLTLLISVLVTSSAMAATEWNSLKAGNPVLPGYFADPSCRKFGDTYYIYATPDGWDVGKGPFCIWSSKDFVNWTSHKSDWPSTDFKWAPSVVQKDGKYYMYNSVPCQIWAAVADTPLGPWKNLMANGKEMVPDQTPKGSIVLDGECFIDTDGKIYLWYSTWWTPTLAKLNPDMSTFDGTPRQYFKSVTTPNPEPGYTVQGCMEAPYMFKRNGIYYLMYSNMYCQNETYRVEYSTAPTPTGPFTYGKNNPILETNEDDTVDGPGHHTILEDGDKIYIVYHRHDNPHDPDGAHRQVCIDELHFEKDGVIEKVIPSHSGVGYLAPSTKRDTNLSLGKPATASSSAGPDYKPEYATDRNNGTLWKADSDTFPQWLQVDLGKSYQVKRIETEFQYAQVVYSYLIESSEDGNKWTTFADRRNNQDWGPMIDKGDLKARYFKITIFGKNTDRKDQVAAIWGFNIYDGIDKPNQAPTVDVGPEQTRTMRFPTLFADAAVFDDGLPNGPVTVQWTKAKGPGEVTFEHPQRSRTKVSFSAPGEYELVLTADDGKLKGTGKLICKVLAPTENLIWYKFDEKSGTIANDSSENGQYGVLSIGTPRSLGVHDGAVNLNGSSNQISVPSLGKQQQITISAWINVHSLKNEPSSIICANNAGEETMRFVINNLGEAAFGFGSKPLKTSEYKFTNNLGEWKHIALTYNSSSGNISFYVDGKLDKSISSDEKIDVDMTKGLRIGAAESVARNLDGEIDEFRIFAKALSANEIGKLAQSGPLAKIADIRKLADGKEVRLLGKSVTYAPKDLVTLNRTTDFFYISEPDGSRGIRVEAGTIRDDKTEEGSTVSFTGTLKTSPSGERFIELLSQPGIGAPRAAKVLDKKIKNLQEQSAAGAIVKITGKIKNISADNKFFAISDSEETANDIKVVIEKGRRLKKIANGNLVNITGVISSEGNTPQSAASILLLSNLTRIEPPEPIGLAFYNFDESEGNVVKDSSTNDFNASLAGTAERISGRKGNAIRFDGQSSFVKLPDLGVHAALTLSLWVNVNSFGKDDFGTSIFHCDGWHDGDLHCVLQKADGLIRLAVGGTAELVSKFSFKDSLNQWVHLALVYDSRTRTMQIYINGKPDAGRGFDIHRPINLSNAKLGSWGENARMFDGLMDDFRLYDRALSEKEIADIYNEKNAAKQLR